MKSSNTSTVNGVKILGASRRHVSGGAKTDPDDRSQAGRPSGRGERAAQGTRKRHGRGPAYPPSGPTFVSAEGVRLTDAEGHAYMDGASGTFNVSLGYKHPEVVQAVQEVLETGLVHLSSSFHHPAVERAERAMLLIAPANLNRVHLKGATGGSTGIEQALRQSYAVTGKRSVVAFTNGHHGQTIATTFVSGMDFRRNRLPAVSLPVVHVAPPDCYRCPHGRRPDQCRLECVDAVVQAVRHPTTGEGDTAAFLAEPILGAGGGITPPPLFWPEVHARLKGLNVPLVFDEVQTFGRTGGFFAASYFGVSPEMIVAAKGISGIGIPAAGAVLMEERFAVLNSGERSLTWGASALTGAAIAATIGVMRAPDFFAQTVRVGQQIRDRLLGMESRFRCIGTIRGTGLMTGIEIVRSRRTRAPDAAMANRIVHEAMRRRLLLRLSEYDRGAFIKVRPPLVMTVDEADAMCDVLESAIAAS